MSIKSPTAAPAGPIALLLNDWPVWWNELSTAHKIFPAAFVGTYWILLNLLKGFRPDHVSVGVLILVLSYAGRPARTLLKFVAPILLTAIIYDSMRFYADYLRGPIHITQPYNFDKAVFGIKTAQGVLTPNEWWQLHTHPILDFFTGFFYLTFVAIFILICGWFRFFRARTGTLLVSAAELARRAPAATWSFFWVNMLGYTTYYWYAAAPPWYVSLYGLGPAKMDVPANAAGCLRFDQLLGTHFFTEMYGRAADVFGAIPSLHVAYPLVAVFFAFRFGTARLFSVIFYLAMCFSAVYLNHHYMLDILWGSTYAILIATIMDQYFLRKPIKAQ